MERICRLCLTSETDRKFDKIYGNQNQKFALKIFLISQVKIIELDENVALICSQCIKELYQCFLFRKKIHTSDEYFRNKFEANEENIWHSYELESNDVLENMNENDINIYDSKKENYQDTEDQEELKIEALNSDEFINYIQEDLKIEALDHGELNDLEYEALEDLDSSYIQDDSHIEANLEIIKVIEPPRRGRKLKTKKRPYNRLTCKICGITLSRRQRLLQHERLHYLDSTKLFYECDMCGKQFNQRFSLIPHFQKHHNFQSNRNERWKCAICENKILPAGKMEVHYRKFHSEFFIDNIQKSQIPKKSPYKSIRKTKEQPPRKIATPKSTSKEWFVCSLCGNSFTCNYRYQKHLNNIHRVAEHEIIQKEESIVQELKHSKNVPCQVCGKPFASLATCKAHEKTHLNLQYICDICGKSFKIKVVTSLAINFFIF